MHLENLVVDALDPQRLGSFWQAAVGGEPLTDEPGIFETRLAVAGGPTLDLCFQRVSDPPVDPPRLVPTLAAASRDDEVERLLALGARRLEDASEARVADPESNPFHVTDETTAYAGSGPIAALTLDSADPERDLAFWGWLTGWTEVGEREVATLRHPSGRGPVLELRPERSPQGTTKNRLHLDVRLEPGESQEVVAQGIVERGGDVLRVDWGELPWRPYTDPSGNELCVLPVASEG